MINDERNEVKVHPKGIRNNQNLCVTRFLGNVKVIPLGRKFRNGDEKKRAKTLELPRHIRDTVLQLWSSTGLGSKYLSEYVVKLLYGRACHYQEYDESKGLFIKKKKPLPTSGTNCRYVCLLAHNATIVHIKFNCKNHIRFWTTFIIYFIVFYFIRYLIYISVAEKSWR